MQIQISSSILQHHGLEGVYTSENDAGAIATVPGCWHTDQNGGKNIHMSTHLASSHIIKAVENSIWHVINNMPMLCITRLYLVKNWLFPIPFSFISDITRPNQPRFTAKELISYIVCDGVADNTPSQLQAKRATRCSCQKLQQRC